MCAYQEEDKYKQSNVDKKAAPKHRWPDWWALSGIDHPDVPFPKFSIVLGDYPGPDEILRRAEETLRREGE